MYIRPFTLDELNEPEVTFKPGKHQFFVVDVKVGMTQSNNDVLKLQLKLQQDGHTSPFVVYDNLVICEKTRWRIKQFFKCVNLHNLLLKEELDTQKLLGATGFAEFENKLNEKKNIYYMEVKRFLIDEEQTKELSETDIQESQSELDDALPF